jgi:CubicO group peptidase (beta-lactamase class C family)
MTRRLLIPLAVAATAFAAPLHAEIEAASEHGFSAARLARIAPVMRQEIEKGTMPGAVTLIARNGEIVHFEAHGFLDGGKTRPMAKASLFRAYSMTKPMVSVAAMALVEQGRMQLRDPIANWIPEMKTMTVFSADGPPAAARPITVQDLLRHTSGLTYGGTAPFPELKQAYEKADVETRDSDLSPEEFVTRLAQIPLAYQPGTRWEYGLSTDVLGVLVERVSGKRLDAYLDELIFQPLRMKDTSFQLRPGQELADAFDSDPQKAGLWKYLRPEQDPGKRYRLGGAAALTTAEDYFRFAQMILNKGELDGERILSRKTVEYMLSDHIVGLAGSPAPTTGPGYGFGLGFAVRKQNGLAVVPGSTGDAMWAGAGGTSFTIDPREQIVAVFMSAAPSTRLHTRMLFKNLIYGALVE